MRFDLKKASNQLESLKLTGSLYDFFCKFWHVNSSDYLSKNWHIRYLCDVISETFNKYMDDRRRFYKIEQEKEAYELKHGMGSYEMKPFKRSTKHLLINVPPRSAKSLIATVSFPVWAWTKDRTLKFICVSFTEELSLFLAQQSMKIVQSKEFEELFGESVFLGRNTAVGNFSLGAKVGSSKDTGFRRSIGLGGTVTGTGGDFIIVDDPIKPGDADSNISDKGLEGCINWYNGTLSSRLNKIAIGVRIIIMQRLHENDLSGHILDSIASPSYEHICLPAEIKSVYAVVKPSPLRSKYKNSLLWPDNLTDEVLKDLSNQMGDPYYGQYLQMPVRPGGAIIRNDWIRDTDHIPDACGRNLIFIDPAYTEDKQNNPTGILVCTVDYHKNVQVEKADVKTYGTIYVLLAQEVWKEFSDLRMHLIQLSSEYTKGGHPPAIYIEPKASGKSIYQGLKRALPGLPLFEIKGEIVDRKDKRGRLSACSVQIQNGNLVFLKDKTADDKKNWNKLLEHQLCSFPYSKNDDLVDCVSYAFWITHKNREVHVGIIDIREDKKQEAEETLLEKAGERISLRPDSNDSLPPETSSQQHNKAIQDYIDKVMGNQGFDDFDFGN